MASGSGGMAGRDRGSGSIYVVIAASALMALSVAGATVGDAVLARHRAESAADLVVIAGATAGLRGGDACLAAAVDADRRGVDLAQCQSADDGSLLVVVRWRLPRCCADCRSVRRWPEHGPVRSSAPA